MIKQTSALKLVRGYTSWQTIVPIRDDHWGWSCNIEDIVLVCIVIAIINNDNKWMYSMYN